MKTNKHLLAAISIATFMIFSNCTRSKEVVPNDSTDQTNNETTQVTASSDQTSTQSELDQATSDLDNVASGASSGARMDAIKPRWIRKVDSIIIDGKKSFTLYYDSANFYGGRKRTGKITYSLSKGTRWKDKGGEITSELDFTVTTKNGKTLKISGTHVLTNISGGTLFSLLVNPKDTIIHESKSSNMKIDFFDGTGSRTWSIARRRKAYLNASILSVMTEGFESKGGYTKVDAWGINRDGKEFYTSISNPIVSTACSDLWLPISGTKEHYVGNSKLSITFGTNSDGNVINSCEATGAFLQWTYNEKVKTKYVAY